MLFDWTPDQVGVTPAGVTTKVKHAAHLLDSRFPA
jgi:hypothetical protein